MPRNSCSTMRITLGKPKRLPALVFSISTDFKSLP